MQIYGGSIAQGYTDALNQMQQRQMQQQQLQMEQYKLQQLQLQMRQQQMAQQNVGNAYAAQLQPQSQPPQPPPQVPMAAPGGQSGAPAPQPGQASVPMQRPMMPQRPVPGGPPQAPPGAMPPQIPMQRPATGMAPQGPQAPAMAPPRLQPMQAPPIKPYVAPGAPQGPQAGPPQIPMQGGGLPTPQNPQQQPQQGGMSLDTIAQTLIKQGVKGQDLFLALQQAIPLMDAQSKVQMAAINQQMRQQQLELAQTREADTEKYHTAMAKAAQERADKTGSGSMTGLTGTALTEQAEMYRRTGKMPPMGQNSKGDRDAIINEAARLDAAEGTSGGDAIARQKTLDADAASLKKLTPQYDAVTAFSNNAKQNGDALLKLADKVDTTGVPAIERWIRAGRQATGDKDVAAFNAQMQLYRTEAAKVMTNPNLTGQLTDSARHEVADFLSGNSSAEQIRSVVNLLTNDFGRREKTLSDQMSTIKQRMSGAPDKTAAPAVGTVKQGYRFKGGDPADQASWEKAA